MQWRRLFASSFLKRSNAKVSINPRAGVETVLLKDKDYFTLPMKFTFKFYTREKVREIVSQTSALCVVRKKSAAA